MLCLQVFANKIVLSEIRKIQTGGSIFCFRYLSVAFQISVSYVSDICFFRIARNRNKQKIFIVSLISINNIKFACFRAICYLCNKEKIKNKHIAGILLTLLKHTNILLGNILEQTHKKRDAMFYEY